MYDVIEKVGESIIQHGNYNNRIYLISLSMNDYPKIFHNLEKLVSENKYTKIFAKVPSWLVEELKSEGFIEEATIPKFYNGTKDLSFVSKFFNQREILNIENKTKIKNNLNLASRKKKKQFSLLSNNDFTLKKLEKKDLKKLAKLYSNVFESYPFPIFNKKYLIETMDNNVVYFGIYCDKKLISASSAEMDNHWKNAEMTDFATDPDYLGNNLSLLLLREMEDNMRKRNIKTVYSITRSYSPGMNITFAKQNYEYTGTLINNTNISGTIESMNVWYKNLSKFDFLV